MNICLHLLGSKVKKLWSLTGGLSVFVRTPQEFKLVDFQEGFWHVLVGKTNLVHLLGSAPFGTAAHHLYMVGGFYPSKQSWLRACGAAGVWTWMCLIPQAAVSWSVSQRWSAAVWLADQRSCQHNAQQLEVMLWPVGERDTEQRRCWGASFTTERLFLTEFPAWWRRGSAATPRLQLLSACAAVRASAHTSDGSEDVTLRCMRGVPAAHL